MTSEFSQCLACMEPLRSCCDLQLSGESAPLREGMFAAVQFARSRGVAGLGQAAAWLNGLLIAPDAGITWQQQLQFNLQLEQQRLQV